MRKNYIVSFIFFDIVFTFGYLLTSLHVALLITFLDKNCTIERTKMYCLLLSYSVLGKKNGVPLYSCC